MSEEFWALLITLAIVAAVSVVGILAIAGYFK